MNLKFDKTSSIKNHNISKENSSTYILSKSVRPNSAMNKKSSVKTMNLANKSFQQRSSSTMSLKQKTSTTCNIISYTFCTNMEYKTRS